MTTLKRLTRKQTMWRFALTLCVALFLLTFIDLYGYSVSKRLGLSYIVLFLISVSIITLATFLISNFINKKLAIWASVLLGIFESSTGQILYIDSANGQIKDPWPPAYLFTIIFYAIAFYFIARLINYFLHK